MAEDEKRSKFNLDKYERDIKNLPLWLQYVVAVATIFGTGFGGWGVYIVLTSGSQNNQEIPPKEIATSTISISEILTKALRFDTVAERQDFLEKYRGSIVSGEGTVEEVSRTSTGFLIDMTVSKTLITCPQEKNEENEKQLLLLKGKDVYFEGGFSYMQIFGHGIGIDSCKLQRL